jgi:tetratricopeptide (TPR) repeat protein
MRVLISALLCAGWLLAQESPDSKAFQAAFRLKDQRQKIAALDRFLVEYPSSSRAATVRRELLVTAVKVDPKDAVRRSKKLAKALAPADAAELNRSLAAELNTAKALPKDSERAARLAVRHFTYQAFAAGAAGGGGGEPQLRARYNTQRGRMNETLAQSLLARGRTDQAKAAFLDALKDNPSLGPAALALGDILDTEGKGAEALPCYAQGLLARGTPESRKKFSDAYVKVKGSAAGEQEYLDERYKALFPSPLHPEKYQKAGNRSARAVLAEVYTGAGCGPCLAADLAFDAVLDRYGRSDVAVVMYHEHIPRPDPMSNTDTVARWKWQQGRGVPTYALDGAATTGGGTRTDAADVEARLRTQIEKRLEIAPLAAIDLSAANDGRAIKANVSVANVAKDSPDLVLNVILVEKELRYSGENGIRFHPMVVRSIASYPLKGKKRISEAHTFDLAAVAAGLEKHIADFEKHDERHNKDGSFRFMEHRSRIDAGHLAVVAFVQDAKTREVLQSVYTEASR